MTRYIPDENFTDDQKNAIITKGNNIIVSAGAGSGKTTVLTDRVLRILLDDSFEDGRKVHINNLIILTFTKNAANGMKEKIRTIINEHDELKEESELLESSYITTFDSYASSLVKKYNYLLDIEKNFTVIDDALLNLNIQRILDDILEELYTNPSKEFADFINKFTTKDDTYLRSCIINMYAELQKKLYYRRFLDNYIDKYYTDEKVNEIFDKYEEDFFKKHTDIVNLYDELQSETINPDKLEENDKNISDFLNATSFDELKDTINFKLNAAYAGYYSDEGKNIKEQISSIINSMKKDFYFTEKEAKELFMSTKEDAIVLVNIIKELDDKVSAFKKEINAYTFGDIASKAIDLVENNDDVCEEIKNNTYEIMIDEYQDTNDIQEEFIKHITNKNVYMVGDIKQSIYRFRNANPYIFKNKYDSYIDESKGIRIDLKQNFRSRNEVVNNINTIFDSIMIDEIGGANYKQEHEMIFGNTSFNDVKDSNQDYNMKILSYDNTTNYNQGEVEAFIIANDIKKKMNNKFKVFQKKKLRDIKYSDFCILVDNSNNFDTIKKVLEYFEIPVAIDKATSIKEDDEIFIFKNIISLLIGVKIGDVENTDFIHSYLSIARSYIYKMDDKDLFDICINKSFKETSLYKLCEEINEHIDSLSNKELLNYVVEKFDIINKLETVGDVADRLTRIEYFINSASSLNEYGMDLYQLNEYFDNMLNSNEKVEMTRSKAESDSVKVMTIHGSKGLEFNYVYLPYIDTDYNRNAVVKNFSFDKDLGFLLPFYKNGVGSTFVRNLCNTNEKLENISERIRLLYVALTRPIEEFNVIVNLTDKDKEYVGEINYSSLSETKSYKDMFVQLYNKINNHVKEIDLNSLGLTRDYNIAKETNYINKIDNTKEKVEIKNVIIESNKLDNKHFSKQLKKVIDKNLKELLEFGTMMHYCFEVYDFNNNNLDELNISDEYKDNIKNFLKHEEVKDISKAITYKEHEIKFNKDGSIFHGFIDLLVEYDDHFDIIDYKLSNVDSEEYVIQLSGYKEYIESTYNKLCNIYLYSIKKDIFKKL